MFKIEVGVDAKFTCKNASKQNFDTPTMQLAMRGGHVLASTDDLDFTVNVLTLCDLSNLLHI